MNPNNPTSGDVQFLQAFIEAGHHPERLNAVMAHGLSWSQLLVLLGQFGQQYGPQLLVVALAVLGAVRAPGGLTLVSIENLMASYGPTVYAMVVTVAGWFSVAVPTIPAA